MKQYKYKLDRSSKKCICPNCGKKRAVGYIDTETGDYLPIEFSRCDREDGCGYWKKPKNTKTSMPNLKSQPSIEPITFLRRKLVSSSGRNFKENNFIQYLGTRFTNHAVKTIIKRYLIGTSTYLKNGCIFWQIDHLDRVRAGKIMKYNSKTGKRIKSNTAINWVLNILKKTGKIKDFRREQCFFGLHLIKEYKNKVIAICESEKTACIMSIIHDSNLWLACGSVTGLQEYKFIPLMGRKIVLYPDKGVYDRWTIKAKELCSKGYDVEVSDIIEKQLGEKGCDVADYFVDRDMIEVIGFANEKNPKTYNFETNDLSQEEEKLKQLARINPKVKNLIETFDLLDVSYERFRLCLI